MPFSSTENGTNKEHSVEEICMRIYNGKLITIENGVFEKGYVDFEEGKIRVCH